jgi:hypothetical protein
LEKNQKSEALAIKKSFLDKTINKSTKFKDEVVKVLSEKEN